jgi:lipid-binding SYLF domain-containing protein
MHMKSTRRSIVATALAFASLPIFTAAAQATTAAERTAAAKRALENLYSIEPHARLYARRAKAILVFPHITKGAFIVGGESGDGVLLRNGRPMGFYNISAASFGFQAGGKTFSYALFFMNDRALRYLDQSGGWAIGAGGNIVVVDQAAAAAANTTTLNQDVYAFPFAQKGLMGGIDIHGSKITRTNAS